ncbi:MAG: hypothetical protein QNJ54_01570 [Prochloraceae cyanobacterium]|nr:hypothetical protein [Prochloraceae cyanobacterium]
MSLKVTSIIGKNGKIQAKTFHALTREELKIQKEIGLINNATYVYYWFRTGDPYNEKTITFTGKELAMEMGIPESSVYDAIAKLKALDLIKIISGKFTIKVNLASNHSQQQSDSRNLENDQYTSDSPSSENLEKILGSRNGLQDPRINSKISENRSSKPAPKADRERSKTIQTNKDFLDLEGEQEIFGDPWLDDEETNTKVDEFKQELERQKAILETIEEDNRTVEAEILEQQTSEEIIFNKEVLTDNLSAGINNLTTNSDFLIKNKNTSTVSTSDKETTTAIVAKTNLNQGEVYSACSTFENKFQARANNPKQTNMDRLKEALNWVPPGVWCTSEGKLDPEFLKWSVDWWMGRFDCKDKYEAKANVLAYYKNDLSKLVIRWNQYSETYLAKYQNADLRISHGCTVGVEEEKELKNNVRAVAKPLPPEMSYEDKGLQQSTNLVAQLPVGVQAEQPNNTNDLPPQNTTVQQLPTKSTAQDLNLIARSEENNSTSAERLLTSDSNKVPEGADNVEAYKSFDRAEYERKRKQEEEQMASPEQWAEFTAKFKTFNKKSSLRPVVEDTEDPLEKVRKQLKTLNSFLESGDAVLIGEALKAAEKENFVVVRNKLGHPIKIEDLEF